MTLRTDRRSVLTGLGAVGLIGCSRPPEATAADVIPSASIAVDFAPLEARHGGRLGLSALVPGGNRVDWRASEQ